MVRPQRCEPVDRQRPDVNQMELGERAGRIVERREDGCIRKCARQCEHDPLGAASLGQIVVDERYCHRSSKSPPVRSMRPQDIRVIACSSATRSPIQNQSSAASTRMSHTGSATAADAEDITSSTIERAERYRDRFYARRADATTWLIGIARRQISDRRVAQPIPVADLPEETTPGRARGGVGDQDRPSPRRARTGRARRRTGCSPVRRRPDRTPDR